MATLGFIGLGIMGRPMAGHLLRAGHTVHVYDLLPEGVQALAAQGAVACTSPGDVARQSDVTFLMVPDSPDVEAALFGPEGVAAGAPKGSIVVDMSSISPVAERGFAGRLRAQGVEMLDAPVSGGPAGAEQATLSIMCGGDERVFAKVRPYFECMGKNINLVGGNGDGQVVKVANQIIVGITVAAVSEALLLASKAGVDPERARQALLGGAADSRILQLHGQRMIKRDFRPGFRLKHQQKDLNNALVTARSIAMALPVTAAVQELFNGAAAEHGGDIDHSALVTTLERLAKHTVA
jgi:2-hydroxy-3-oxopropionate reductase